MQLPQMLKIHHIGNMEKKNHFKEAAHEHRTDQRNPNRLINKWEAERLKVARKQIAA